VCISSCPSATFNNSGICSSCDRHCRHECTGSGPSSCDACVTAELNGTCLDTCPSGYFNNKGQCQLCDEQCRSSCSGPASNQCFGCKAVNQNGFCVASCLPSHFPSATNHTCLACHPLCDPAFGCSGRSASECGRCLQATSRSGMCLSSCENGQFADVDRTCQACNIECLSCTVRDNSEFY
jgi:hypothetical protein